MLFLSGEQKKYSAGINLKKGNLVIELSESRAGGVLPHNHCGLVWSLRLGTELTYTGLCVIENRSKPVTEQKFSVHRLV